MNAKKTQKNPLKRNRVLRFAVGTALVLGTTGSLACGGSEVNANTAHDEEVHSNLDNHEEGTEHSNVAHEEEHSNMAAEEEPTVNPAPEEEPMLEAPAEETAE